MSESTLIANALPERTRAAIIRLGKNIARARKRRGLTQQALADRMFTTPRTLYRLERGDPRVGLDVLASALHALGLDEDLLRIADPDTDRIGLFAEARRLPKRVRPRRSAADKLDF